MIPTSAFQLNQHTDFLYYIIFRKANQPKNEKVQHIKNHSTREKDAVIKFADQIRLL